MNSPSRNRMATESVAQSRHRLRLQDLSKYTPCLRPRGQEAIAIQVAFGPIGLGPPEVRRGVSDKQDTRLLRTARWLGRAVDQDVVFYVRSHHVKHQENYFLLIFFSWMVWNNLKDFLSDLH
jgi:hypothetical protein